MIRTSPEYKIILSSGTLVFCFFLLESQVDWMPVALTTAQQAPSWRPPLQTNLGDMVEKTDAA